MLRPRFFSALLLLTPLAAQTGIITTIAGTGARGFSGDNGPATGAALGLANLQNQCDPNRFEQTSHISFDAKGNLYLADSNNQRIRRIDPAGIITTLSGDGTTPAAAPTCAAFPAASPHLFNPADILPLPNGSLLVADQQNNRILQIAPGGTITTLAGNGLHNLFAPGIPATSSPMDWPAALAVDSAGLIYFAEIHSNRIGRINADGRLATIAGNGFPGTATLTKPAGIAIDPAGNVLIADTGNHRIRKAAPNGTLTTIAGTGTQSFCGDNGPAINACFDTPMDVKLDTRGNIYIADTGNHRIRRIDKDSGIITTVAGTGVAGRGSDRVAATASALNSPNAIALDANNDLYIVDWQNFLIRKVAFPAISAGGIVDGASFSAPPAPGGIFSLFGANFSAGTEGFTTVPLPTTLAGVSLEINGTPVPLYLVSPTQINAQLPFETSTGSATAVIVTPAGRSAATTFNVVTAAPAIFLAVPVGDGVITAYVTGLGAVSPAVPTGAAAPLDILSYAQSPPTATLGGVPAPVQFAGLAPGFAGLGQVNILVPPDAPKGDAVPLVLEINGQKANPYPSQYSRTGLLACLLALLPCLARAAEPPRQNAGPYLVTLRLPPDGLYAQEEMQIEFRIEDTTRPDPLTVYTAVIRATPEAVIDMPAMPGMPPFTETAHAEGTPGDYGIHPTFAHGGEFRLRLTIQPGVTADFPLTVLDSAPHRKRLPPRYTLELTTDPKKPKAGDPVEFRLTVRDRDNRNTPAPAYDVMHEKLLHLILVRRDLTHFAHEHPTLGPDGVFRLRYTFASAGDYSIFADVAPKGAGAQTLFAPLSVSGKPQPPTPWPADLVELVSAPQVPLRKTVAVTIRIKDPANLEPYLGALGHLILIHSDAATFVHCHPDDRAGVPGTLVFQARFPKPGLYHAWLQFQRAGQVLTTELSFEAGQ